MPAILDAAALASYLQIISINVVLSGDNVVVIGLAAASVRSELRQKAIIAGIAAATLIRIVFALVAVQLLALPGLQLVGGLLLFWVCWKMFGELRQDEESGPEAGALADGSSGAVVAVGRDRQLSRAIVQIVIADVSMSLDNVLAVAGAARQDVMALVFGLVLSVALMGLAAALVARLLSAYRWISWLGLAIIVYVAAHMTFEGAIAIGHLARIT